MHIPIVMVMGNHEYYRRFVPHELTLARPQASAFNITFWKTTQPYSAVSVCRREFLDRLPSVRRIQLGRRDECVRDRNE